MKYILLSSILILISACSSTGPKYTNIAAPVDGSSHLYIYRPDVYENSFITPGLKLDDKEVLLIEEGGYSYLTVRPGTHTLELVLSDNYIDLENLTVTTEPNRKTFVKVLTYNESEGVGAFRRVFTLTLTKEEIAEREIEKCGYIDPSKSSEFSKGIFVDD